MWDLYQFGGPFLLSLQAVAMYRFLISITLVVYSLPSLLNAGELLDWQQCLIEARKANPDLHAAFAALQEAEEQSRSVGALLLPTVDAGAGVFRNGLSRSESGMPSTDYQWDLVARQLLYDGNRRSSQYDASKADIERSRWSERQVSAKVRYLLRSSYANLLKAQEMVGLVADIADRREKNFKMVRLRYEAGRENIGSLRRAEADVVNARYEMSRASRGLHFAQGAMCSALGRNARQDVRVTGEFKGMESFSVRPDFSAVAWSTPYVEELAAEKKRAAFELDAAKNSFSPELYMHASAGGNAVDTVPVDELAWRAGVDLLIPIYAGGDGHARVAKAKAAVRRTEADVQSGYLSVLDDLEDAWNSFVDAGEYLSVRKAYLTAALERARIADAQYANGLLSFNNWIIIEDDLVRAQTAYLDAGADLLLVEALWIFVKGGGIDDANE